MYKRSYHNLNYKDLTRKTVFFFEGWSWFKFNNLGLALGKNLKCYTSLSKGLKLKVRKFWGLNPTFVEVTGKKLVGVGAFPPSILNRVKGFSDLRFLINTYEGLSFLWSFFPRQDHATHRNMKSWILIAFSWISHNVSFCSSFLR